ncbi:MAG: 50S ribosomal protein L19 [Candidatus Omnitrophica bacterium]|nr:50S ribosomal protein L19 [Candidatus Omnitrophota bacterium]MBU1127538.1 50S ribosomal protein L19 [Candidatus Omnitrophota bacterium]MBU1656942.1 50S ribosomal protein L19 [Candidatus Omnitrophota bacterium]MBU1783948.1 50S ribosomal protein L19 [Candidatus Omnitrophota bacterium]MBU1851393.1 50S ribosomal protein L19 [Candidatus Omnitrophota bacterium]
MKKRIADVEKKHMRKEEFKFDIGDTVDVHFRVSEGDKTRIQIFSGIVIAKKGSGTRETFNVRRISYGEGVERVFPLNSPLIEKIAVKKKGHVKRAKLYYLRGRKGKKATKVKEKVG